MKIQITYGIVDLPAKCFYTVVALPSYGSQLTLHENDFNHFDLKTTDLSQGVHHGRNRRHIQGV